MEKYQADQSFQKQYEKYVKQVTPTHNLALQMLHAFGQHHAVLSPADSDENFISVFDHVIIHDCISCKAAYFFECHAH